MMNELFRDLITRGILAVYIDNLFIFTETLEEHKQVTREVLQILFNNNLFVKPETCIWAVTEVEFLDMDIAAGGVVKMSKSKVKGVLSWKEPQNV